ncbi:hypothetical protein ACJ7Z2_10145 [Mannheimia glucosida]|uniref:hypothetical protein n=1 Tax=Mannheimia glucosida TaxID=85401 RepID=UPI00391825F6
MERATKQQIERLKIGVVVAERNCKTYFARYNKAKAERNYADWQNGYYWFNQMLRYQAELKEIEECH